MTATGRQIELQVEVGDAPEFVSLVERIVNGLVNKYGFDEISLVKISNWFDHKWLNYSGKAVLYSEETLHPDKVALKDSWKDQVTVPPFNPKRVLSELIFLRQQTDNIEFEKILHRQQRSTDNQNNRMSSKSENGLFVWYSSNTISNNQGSLMVYQVNMGNVYSWYASIENKEPWKITRLRGISMEVSEEIMNNERYQKRKPIKTGHSRYVASN